MLPRLEADKIAESQRERHFAVWRDAALLQGRFSIRRGIIDVQTI